MSVRRMRGRVGSWCLVLVSAIAGTGTSGVEAVEKSKTSLDPPPKKLVLEGMRLFLHQWKAGDKQARGGDGLGPMFNETSCAACHNLGGTGGAGPVKNNVQILSRQVSASQRADVIAKRIANVHPGLIELPATVMHLHSTRPGYDEWRAKRVGWVPVAQRFLPSAGPEKAAAGLVDANEFGFGPFVSSNIGNPTLGILQDSVQTATRQSKPIRVPNEDLRLRLTERNTTALFGDGLIDSIPDAVIKAQVSANAPVNNRQLPTIGKPVILPDGRVGKFGWKAQHATLAEFALTACAVEVGLEVPGHHQGTDPRKPGVAVPDYDMNQADCDALVAFVAALPAPRREPPERASAEMVSVGETVFGRIGCSDCHRRTLGEVDGIYSDLLAHDMGPSAGDVGYYSMFVADFAQNADPNKPKPTVVAPREWRTPPLWGVADSAPYLHDGRAATLEDAIQGHAGQADESKFQFVKLPSDEKGALIAFLQALKSPFPEQLANTLARAER